MRLKVTTHRGDEHLLIAVYGVLDSESAAHLEQHLLAAIDETSWQHVTVDLSGVKLLKLAGVDPLVAAYWRATDAGSGFGVAAPHQPVRSALVLGRLDWLIAIYTSVRDALDDADAATTGLEDVPYRNAPDETVTARDPAESAQAG